MESAAPIRMESFDALYDTVETEFKVEREDFKIVIQELLETGWLELLGSSDDTYMYKAKTGITWTHLAELADPMKKHIILPLIDNPKCFFILFNTQKGKLRLIGEKMAQWSTTVGKRVVSYLVVDNDRTLSEQSVNGLFHCFKPVPGKETSTDLTEKYPVRIFELSSNNKVSLRDVKTYIDAYAFNETYFMPLIVVLANNTQIAKLIEILVHIQQHVSPLLCAAGGWDEADKTYPQYRSKRVPGASTTFLDLLNAPATRIMQNGFVTATEGELIEEEYPECANAYHYPVEIDPVDESNYFAFHKEEAEKHFIEVHSREANNIIAERILAENWDTHFGKPIPLPNGTLYHHKIIINADVKADQMKAFAKAHRARAHVITFNMLGVRLYTADGPTDGKLYSARKQNLNRLLFYIYKMNKLENKPLCVIGRRKVDRGLGFHYAPRIRGPRTTSIEGKDGFLTTDGFEGLIWTNMIMGNKIDHTPTAVQKAGRGAGIIRQCPQYPGKFHYWIDKETARAIEHHYKKVDKVNELMGTNTILQAVTHAEAIVPRIRQNHDVDMALFRVIRGANKAETLELTKKIVTEVFHETFRAPEYDRARDQYKTSLNRTSDVVSVIDAIKKVPGAYGTRNQEKKYRRFLPCYLNVVDATTLCCVIPLIDPSYTTAQKEALETRYASKFLRCPQEGDMPH